ncbi:hypothetical protein GCK72_012612 [Caenorhabditis remanei]|uniref:SPK domain-containing protein n=1 Tax=Caenorhabditis remanei TaxID=31234 RepID=A0A6A5GNY5_CAERE|nr:hypothetical protein GCK72_012612 [Caenorhabditis remanei]KAF1756159.1 hypothetical protein GCK72_012612 [Caenorhabditis remanei]
MLNETTLKALQKAKVMILLSLPGDNKFFEELEKETEILVKDTQNRITKIQLKDGNWMFESDYTPERWRKQRGENGRSKQLFSSTDRQKSILNNAGTKKRYGSSLFDVSCAGVSQSGKKRRANSSAGSTSELPQTVKMNQGIEETSSSTSSAPAPGNNENRRNEIDSSATNASLTTQRLASTLSPSETENLRKGRPYLRQITLRRPNCNLTEKERQQAATSVEHFQNLLEDLQSFFKNRRNYKLDAKIEESRGILRTSNDSEALQNRKQATWALIEFFFEDMEAFVASSNQDVRILGKKNLGRAGRTLMKKMNVTVSYDDIKAAIVKFLEILAWLSSSV